MTEKQTTLAILVQCGMDPSSHQYLMEAFTGELTRRREYIAGLEMALRRSIQGLENLIEVRRLVNGRYGNLTREEIEESIAEQEAALYGSTSALDAMVAEAVAKVTEERDGLLNDIAMMREPLEAAVDRDARMKTQGRREGLEEAIGIIGAWPGGDFDVIAIGEVLDTLRQLAAQAGEVRE